MRRGETRNAGNPQDAWEVLTPVNALTEKDRPKGTAGMMTQAFLSFRPLEGNRSPYRLILISSFKISSLVVITRELA